MKTLACLVAWVVISLPVRADVLLLPNFSVDPASPSILGPVGPDDILQPGPAVQTHGITLGLQDNFLGGNFDVLDGLSYGQDPIANPLYFSVDRVSVGLPGSSVFNMALPGTADAARHVYAAIPPSNSNVLVIDGSSLGLVSGFFGDDLNALEIDTVIALHKYFSIDSLSASNAFGGLDLANDIFLDVMANVFASGETHMGLDIKDDLDGLVLDDTFGPGVLNPGIDRALFSLSSFSPSAFTFSGNPYAPGVKGSLSPADILVTDFTGGFQLWAPAASLGLHSNDNVNALDTVVPEPTSLWLCATALAVYCFRRSDQPRAEVT